MKKYLLSAAFVSLLGLAAQAQDSKSQQGSRNSSADHENNKATLAPADQKAETVEQQPQAGSQQNDATKQKGATRMAITEKGVPASKNKDVAPDQKATEQKKAEPAKSPKN